MKKLLVILAVLFLLPFLSAVEFDMKTNFSQGETLMAKVSGNLYVPISKEDISFFRGHVRTSIIPFVEKIDGDFYIYAQLFGKAPNNYSIVIENVRSIKFGQITEEDITMNFSITDSLAEFSIDPGFLSTKTDFSIEVRNLVDNGITINVANFSYDSIIFPEVDSITLNSGEIGDIDFEIDNESNSSLNIIKLSSGNLEYDIPVYVFQALEKNESVNESLEKGLAFEQGIMEVTMATDSEAEEIIYLKNTGEMDLENITIFISDSLVPYLSLSRYEIDELESGESKRIYVYISSDDEEVEIEGQIVAVSTLDIDEIYAYEAVFLNFLPGYISTDEDQTTNQDDDVAVEDQPKLSETCSELGGIICDKNYECSGKAKHAKDGVCCLDSCNEVKKSSKGKIIGWIIIVAIFFFGGWFYLTKYKKVGRNVNLLRRKR